jgi:hypothetical protein
MHVSIFQVTFEYEFRGISLILKRKVVSYAYHDAAGAQLLKAMRITQSDESTKPECDNKAPGALLQDLKDSVDAVMNAVDEQELEYEGDKSILKFKRLSISNDSEF